MLNQISNIKWIPPETINQYNTRFLDVVNRASTLLRAPCMDANSLLRFYLKGLPCLAHVHIGDTHANYMEAMTKATEWSRVMHVRATSGTPADQAAAFNMMTMGMPAASGQAVLNAMPTQPTRARPEPQQPNYLNGPATGPPQTIGAPTGYGLPSQMGNTTREPVECYTCGERNHIARDCPTRSCQVCSQYGHTQVNCPLMRNLRVILQNEGLNAAHQRLRFHPYERSNQNPQMGNRSSQWNQGPVRQFRSNLPYGSRGQPQDNNSRRMVSMVSAEPTQEQTQIAIEALGNIAHIYAEANADTERIPGTNLPPEAFDTMMAAVNSMVSTHHAIEDGAPPSNQTLAPDEGNGLGAPGA